MRIPFLLSFWISMLVSSVLGQESSPPDYILGVNDQITLSVPNLDEMSGRPTRIDMNGDINIPIAGRIHVAGLTAGQLESRIESLLQSQLNRPRVIVNIAEFRSQPVTLLGAVNAPGVHQLEGRKTLFEILSLAGGLRPDSGNTVKITRELKWGRIPLPNAKGDATGQYTVASISVKSIINSTNPSENIVIKPNDIITVLKADLIYIIGSVKRPGGYVLGQDESMSALQVLSLAEGLERTAAGAKAMIMRTVPGNLTRTEIPINLSKLMAGKVPDLQMKSDDILFVPNSTAKTILTRGSEAAIAVGTGIAVYSHP